MALNDVYKTSQIFDHGNADGELVITIHYQLQDIQVGLSEDNFCIELARGVQTAVANNYLPIISAEYEFERVECYNETQPQFQGVWVAQQLGALAGEIVSLRSCPVVAKKSGLRGRRYNGRNYLLAPPEAFQSGGVIDPNHIDDINTYFNSNLDTIITTNGNTYVLGIWSTKYSIFSRATAYICRSNLGTQRGRFSVN